MGWPIIMQGFSGLVVVQRSNLFPGPVDGLRTVAIQLPQIRCTVQCCQEPGTHMNGIVHGSVETRVCRAQILWRDAATCRGKARSMYRNVPR